jgi:hypothetical protein
MNHGTTKSTTATKKTVPVLTYPFTFVFFVFFVPFVVH